ncbi:MAG: hypothetical protein CEE42_01365 [Promethearchaeota archaeon Loki_b31]|nr:MAG: hypothetical protein CEE42_01365 [Candidatus Lokiarchaeota archaeon Loki_b31]
MLERLFVRPKRKSRKFLFGLNNFKSFKENQLIEIKPLTIICGVNNCGKSSIIQSLLLSSQSLELTEKFRGYPLLIRYPYDFREPIYKTSLLFEGDLCHLSDFYNVLNRYSKDKEFSFNFEIESTKFSVTFFNPYKENPLEAYVKNIDIIGDGYNLQIESKFEENNDKFNYSCLIKKLNFQHLLWRCPFGYFKSRKYLSNKNFEETFIINHLIKDIKVIFNGFLPEKLLLPYDRFSNEINLIIQRFGEGLKELKSFKKRINEELEFILLRTEGKTKDYGRKIIKETYYSFFEYYENKIFEDLLKKFHYIGPLRDEPHRYYQFYDIRNLDIGNKGQYAAQILTLEGDLQIPTFKTFEIKDGKLIFEKVKLKDLSLKKGLSIWFKKLNLPSINPKKLEHILFKIVVNLQKSDEYVTLQDVGFGISQILPVYVESLRMEKGHTLVLEQPEIHLHPSMQSKLADFLISMAISGKNFLIETHSEHLINRICLRIAQDHSNTIKNIISLVFVEPPKEDKTGKFIGSKIKRIILNNYGEIENWPVGFFDDLDSGKIIQAAIKKRKKEANGEI